MHKRPNTSVIIIILLLTALAAPVIAQDTPALSRPDQRFDHTVQYDIGGWITINRQLGHECTTGAVKRTTVRGYGEMTKLENVRIAGHIINVDEVTDWSVPVDAIAGLTVTTTIQLCSRPMSAAAEVYELNGGSIEVGDIINVYDPVVVSGLLDVNALTQQLWATSLVTNPGHAGSYHSNFIAAYGPGPYERLYGDVDQFGFPIYYDEDYMWEYIEGVHWSERDDKRKGYPRGDYYVGNYFEIDQFAYTSGGELRRLISMSSPFENTILIEDMSVIGSASIRESFKLHNLIGGPKAITLAWYELF